MTSKREETRERDTLLAEKDMADGAVTTDAAHADPAPDEESEVPTDAVATARRLWEAAAGQRWRVVVAAVCAVAYVCFSLAAPAYSAGLVDLLWANIQEAFAAGTGFVVTLDNGGTQILTFLGIWTAAWVFYTVQSLVMASFAERLNLGLRRQISAKVGRLPLSYYDAHQPGDTISRATNDLDKVSEVLQRGLLQLLISVVTLVGATIMMARYNLALTGVFLVFAVASFVLTKVVSARTLVYASERQASLGRLTGKVEEAYSGRAVIKSFGRDDASAAEIAEAAEAFARTSERMDFVTNAISPAIRFLTRLAQVGIGLLAGLHALSTPDLQLMGHGSHGALAPACHIGYAQHHGLGRKALLHIQVHQLFHLGMGQRTGKAGLSAVDQAGDHRVGAACSGDLCPPHGGRGTGLCARCGVFLVALQKPCTRPERQCALCADAAAQLKVGADLVGVGHAGGQYIQRHPHIVFFGNTQLGEHQLRHGDGIALQFFQTVDHGFLVRFIRWQYPARQAVPKGRSPSYPGSCSSAPARHRRRPSDTARRRHALRP